VSSVASLTGMRRGELLGLRWSDVDLERHTLSIANTRTNVDGKAIEGPPKTARSRRSLKLSAAHVQVLISVAQRQDHLRTLFGENYVDSGLVFTDDHGRPLEPDSVSKRFQKAVEKAGFTVIRFHDLRHTHASIAINGGEHIKAVSARLGHADIGFTLRQYTHLMPEHQGLPADGVADALFGTEDSCDQTCDQSEVGMQKAPSGKGA
jgi:integrase